MNDAEREVLRAALEALTGPGDALHAYAVSGDRYCAECNYCPVQTFYEKDADGIDLESFQHAPDCPITTARALLHDEPPPPTPHAVWQAAVLAAAERVADEYAALGAYSASGRWHDAGEALVDVASERPAKEDSE